MVCYTEVDKDVHSLAEAEVDEAVLDSAEAGEDLGEGVKLFLPEGGLWHVGEVDEAVPT